MKNDTWELTKLPEGRKPMRSKGVFKVNYRSDRTVERFKGRLVAKEFTQIYGIDYDETFSPRPVVRFSSIRALLDVHNDMLIHQMALNRVQQIHVYISNMVTVTIVAIYVDDLIIISKTAEEMRTIKKNLSARFKMKDMGRLHYCLEVNIEQDECNKCLWIH